MPTDAHHRTRAGVRTIEIGDGDLAIVVLHGRAMEAADLAPFARSLGVAARFVFPDAPLLDHTGARPGRDRAWWPVDSEARLRALTLHGALDLHAMDPPGRAEARALLGRVLVDLAAPRLVLVGFSQGGMLAMDYTIAGDGPRPDALALLSSTRIALADWTPRLRNLARLPVLVSHGTADAELAFSAGENLRDLARGAGAEVTWVPFDGPHEIPLVVWRALRKFLRALP
ncbi:MAG: hypothetical protein NT062_33630 [Proteobacteria bacterium]|nr:hypothetical protein [Pseudomonadota bacterium]